MSLIEGIFAGIVEVIFEQFIYKFIKVIGASIRWIFIRKNYSYSEIYKQDWNFRVGLLSIILLVVLIFLFFFT